MATTITVDLGDHHRCKTKESHLKESPVPDIQDGTFAKDMDFRETRLGIAPTTRTSAL